MKTGKSNILYISSFGDLRGGGQRSLLLLIKYLDREKFTPFLVVPCEGDLSQEAQKIGVKIFIIPFPRAKPFGVFLSIPDLIDLKRVVTDCRIDLIHTDSPREVFYAKIIGKFVSIPVVLHARVADYSFWMDNILYSLVDRVIAVSQAAAARFVKIDKKSKVMVVYNGVELKRFISLGKDHDNKKYLAIGYFGRIDRQKGIETVIRAVKRLGKGIRLVITGDGQEQYLRELKKLAVNITDAEVTFETYKADILSDIANIDLGILSSLRAEGLPRAMIECMAMGKIVIASDLPAHKEILGEEFKEFIFPAGDDRALSDIIKNIAADQHILTDKSGAIRQRAERLFDIEKNTKKIENIYTVLLRKVERISIPGSIRGFIKSMLGYCRCSGLARILRTTFYFIFDLAGSALFFILRLLHFLPPLEKFDPACIRKILVIRLDRLGDLVISTPAIRALRKTFNTARIDLLVSAYNKDLAVNNPNIDGLLVHNKDIIDKDYDLAIALHPGRLQHYLTFISGAKFRVGYQGQEGGFFLTHKLKDDRQHRPRHEVESALEVMGVIGCRTQDKRLEVSVTQAGERFAEDFFHKNNLTGAVVLIHPGARQSHVRWPKERFAAVADRLIREEKVAVILTGSPEEALLISEIESLMQEEPFSAVGITLTGLVSLLKRCRLYVGNITGPMHIACALGVPVVAITAVTHPLDSYKAWGPWGEGHLIVRKESHCPKCHPTDCRDFHCLKLITADDVFQAAKIQLEKANLKKDAARPIKKDKVAAVIVTYNNVGGLKELLYNILDQNTPVNQIVVVDNASKDGTEEMVKEKFPNITYVRFSENTGSAGGYHEGIRVASSHNDFIWTLDDDVWVAKNTLRNLVDGFESLQQTEKLGAVRSVTEGWKGGSKPVKMAGFAWKGSLIKAELTKELGLPNKDFFIYGEDTEYSLRIAKQGYSFFWIPSSVCVEKRKDDKAKYNFFGRSLLAHNKALLLYYAFRGSIYMYLKYRKPKDITLTFLYGIEIIFCIFVYEGSGGWPKIKMIGQGIIDGFLGRMSRRINEE